MNTNSINTISKYLLLLLLILTGASCNDNDDAEDTSIPVLISQNINDGDVVGPSGYVELTFSKAMRQAPDTEIYFNGGVVEAAKAAAEKGIQVSVLGVGMPDGAPIPVEGTNDYRRDREGNVIVTRLNEAMCQEIAKEGKGIYVRVDNSNSAQKAINQEVNKMAKSDVESKVYTEFNEQFQAIAWVILLLLLAEILILDRKNPLFKNIHLFSNKK